METPEWEVLDGAGNPLPRHDFLPIGFKPKPVSKFRPRIIASGDGWAINTLEKESVWTRLRDFVARVFKEKE